MTDKMVLSVSVHYPKVRDVKRLHQSNSVVAYIGSGGTSDITMFFDNLSEAQAFVSALQSHILDISSKDMSALTV